MMIGRKVINVARQIQTLVCLQGYVNKEYKLGIEKKTIQNKLEQFQIRFEQAKKKHEIAQQELKSIKLEVHQLEKELQINRDELSQLRNKEQFIQTQKEYIALDAEEQIKKDKVKDLTELIDQKHNKQIEFEKQLDNVKEQLHESKNEYQQQVEKYQEKIDKINERLDKFEKEKKDVVDAVNIEVLNRFERIVANKSGIGIIPVVNGSCEGCNILVAPVVISKIRSCKELVVCINCSRILYLPSLPSVFG